MRYFKIVLCSFGLLLFALFFVLLVIKLVHFSNIEKDLIARIELMESKNVSLNRKLMTSVNNSFDVLEQKYNSMYELITSSKKDLSLDSIELLLNMANQYLLITGNCNKSILFLEKAKLYLDLIDENEQVHILRNSINKDINKLKKIPAPDISSYLVSLDKLSNLSDRLLNYKTTSIYTNSSNNNIYFIDKKNNNNISFPYLHNFISYLQDASRYIYHTIGSFIKINRINNDSFLKDNSIHIMLNQQILIAKFALLTHQYDLLSFNIKVISDILSNYATNSKFVSDAIEVVSSFNDVILFNDFLDISDTLNSMKCLRSSHS